MRIQYQSKMYRLKKYDFASDKFETTNGTKLKLEDIEAIILDKTEFLNLKDVKITENSFIKKKEVKTEITPKTTKKDLDVNEKM